MYHLTGAADLGTALEAYQRDADSSPTRGLELLAYRENGGKWTVIPCTPMTCCSLGQLRVTLHRRDQFADKTAEQAGALTPSDRKR